jgi:hypothetical protein
MNPSGTAALLLSNGKLESCFITLLSSGQTAPALHIIQFEGDVPDTVFLLICDMQVDTGTLSHCHI